MGHRRVSGEQGTLNLFRISTNNNEGSQIVKLKRATAMILVAACMAMSATQVFAGYGIGTVGSVLVGRLGYQVYVQLTNASFSNFACGTPNASSTWQWSFSTQSQSGRDMLATVLAAKASGTTLQVVGTGTCSQDPNLEDASYVIAW